MSKRRKKKGKPACNQLNKPAVGAAQKDVECGVISCMKDIEKICGEKENILPTRVILKRWQGNSIKW